MSRILFRVAATLAFAFLAYYVVFALVKPEPPHYVAVGILVLLTITGLFQGRFIRRAESS